MKLRLTAQKDYTKGANFAVSHASLVNENIWTVQPMVINQDAFPAKKGRNIWTRNIILINAEDAHYVMESMV